MDKNELQHQSKKYLPAILLDQVFAERSRRRSRMLVGVLVVLSILGLALTRGGERTQGIFLVFASLWIALWLLEFFYYSYYFLWLDRKELTSWELKHGDKRPALTFSAATYVRLAESNDDPTAAFAASLSGGWILFRLGVSKRSCKDFLEAREHAEGRIAKWNDLAPEKIAYAKGSLWGMKEMAMMLIDADPAFLQFLLQAGLDQQNFIDAADWFDRYEKKVAEREQWWSRRELARLPGLAKDWAYGRTYYLDHFSEDLLVRALSIESDDAEEKEVNDIEIVLARSGHANILLIGEKDQTLDLVVDLAKKIREGTAFQELQHKRPVLLDMTALVAEKKEKIGLEQELIRLLNEAVKAGNIIVVFGDFAQAIANAHSVGTDLVSVIDPYLASNAIQFIALSNEGEFHQSLESHAEIMNRFEKIIVKEPEERTLTHIIEEEVVRYEGKHRVSFTLPAIQAIVESVSRYFNDASGPDKARELFLELMPQIRKTGKNFITKEDVLELVERKTGIPLGEVKSGAESDKLLNLERLLHERVIGQEEALSAISSALRRARSGINAPNRPIGSFLFMGPTGVGKTETAKALAFEFFGAESHMLRLDMTEYKGEDALPRLIGSFEGGAGGAGKSGVLSSMLRDHQYGVLLVDEFEKASVAVHDLFLQILDEGYFSDMNGKKVNARNTIIIATSNAASDLIWQMVGRGEDLQSKKQELMDSVIASGIFKPELMNRFDGIIIFHPLTKTDVAAVARLMLGRLSARLGQKGMDIVVTPELIAKLVDIGSDQKFGGRAMNRAITEHIEEIVARKIISREARAGSKITIDPSEIA